MNDLIAASFNLKYKLKPITIQFYAVYSFLKYCISFESKIKDGENYQRNLLEFIIYYGHVWTKDNSYDFDDKAFVSLENEMICSTIRKQTKFHAQWLYESKF